MKTVGTFQRRWLYHFLLAVKMPPGVKTAAVLLAAAFISCAGPLSDQRVAGIRQEIETCARSFLNTPYRWGGEDRNGMDCSGLVIRVYREVLGWNLPHSSARLYRLGKTPVNGMEKGDLIFFQYSSAAGPDHVGIFLGRGRFIHASTRGVVISGMNFYYRRHFFGSRTLF